MQVIGVYNDWFQVREAVETGSIPARHVRVPGAIVGGLIIGVGEKLSEVYLGPHIGGGIEIWFGYVLVLFVLLVRPQGLFGEKIIDRV